MIKQLIAVSLTGLVLQSRLLSTNATSGPLQIELEATQGYRVDRLTWSISGPHNHPNILSELTYKNIQIYQTRLLTNVTWKNYFAKLELGYGSICCGSVQDSDYYNDNRKNEISRARSNVPGNWTLDAIIKCGRNFSINKVWTLSPLVGYTFNTQKFRMNGGVQIIDISRHGGVEKKYEHIHGLNSHYRAQWNAPFVGLRGARALNKKFQVFAEGDFLFAIQYNAHAYWNLKNLSFKQDSNRYKGYGYIGILGADYQLLKNLTLKTELQFSHFEAKGGINKSSSVGVPFRKAILTSYEARLGLNYAF